MGAIIIFSLMLHVCPQQSQSSPPSSVPANQKVRAAQTVNPSTCIATNHEITLALGFKYIVFISFLPYDGKYDQ